MVPLIVFALVTHACGRPVLPVPEFQIDLDLEPEERFRKVIAHFEKPIYEVFNSLANNVVVRNLYEQISKHRGPETAELAGEIRGISKYSKIPLQAVHTAQFLYELQTIMIPVENVTWPWGQTTFRTGQEPSFGCTGIIARSASDGTVTHARNLDFSFAKWLANMTYTGVFYKGGQEVFTSQMIAGYTSPLTAMRRGKNGYTVEINTRFPPKEWNVKNLIDLLFKEKRETSGWIKRQVLQGVSNFEDAVKAFSSRPYASTEYTIVSGNQKGVILARDPDDIYHTLTLGPNNNDYILMTNFDYWDHDFKEWLDPTSIHFGHSRRVGAEKLLNASKDLDFNQLYKILDDEEVIGKDTIYQGFMNVETNSFKSFLPGCQSCGGCVDHADCIKEGESCCSERSHYTMTCGKVGGYRCGCLPDGACRYAHLNTTRGDEDCCSFQSHFSLACPAAFRRCGPASSKTSVII